MKQFAVALLLLLTPALLFAQDYTAEDMAICNSTFSKAIDAELADAPIGDALSGIGKTFLGVDYVAHTLETDGEEQLVVNLRGLDCTTFMENSLILARCLKKGDTTFAGYMAELQNSRYRNGVIDGYPSRYHYTSDWMWNAEQKGLIEDITEELGGEPINFGVSFMSENPDKYEKLDANPEFVPLIAAQEDAINSREYHYIPVSRIADVEQEIHNGDIIGIVTNIPGLDISHLGIAVEEDDGRIHFMHAPLAGSKVQITKNPLPSYIAKYKKNKGIVVLRPMEPAE